VSGKGDARAFETSIEIDAPPKAVWKALTDAKELERWFPIHAKVKPGVGGSIWLSWGEGAATGEAPITIWEPGRRFQWQEHMKGPWSGGPVEGAGPWVVSIDFFIEARAGGGTVLRLVQSGFGKGQGWDDDYDSIANGWKHELRSMKQYLEHHRGRDRVAVYEKSSVPMKPEEAFAALTGARGLTAEGRVAGLKPGERYRVKAATGDVYEGRVLIHTPGRSFIGTVEALDDAVMRVEVERWGDKAGPFVWFSLWGEAGKKAGALKAGWRRVLDEVFEGK
jgi:uncharacterized protein YndB with AHSA1/START domain